MQSFRSVSVRNSGHADAIAEYFAGLGSAEGAGATDAREPSPVQAGTSEVPLTKTLFICFVNRSGSNYLATFLASTGYLNRAREIFNAPAVIEVSRTRGYTSLAQYCHQTAVEQARNGLFVAKASSAQLALLADAGLLGTVFPNPHFLHIERSDVLAQAISWHLASQTKQWTSRHDARIEVDDVGLKTEQVEQICRNICRQNEELNRFFALNGITKYALNYEHFCRDPRQHVLAVLDWLGVANFPFDHDIVLERQDDPIKTRWRQQFLTTAGGAPTPEAQLVDTSAP